MIMKNNRNSNKKKGAFLLRPVQVQNGRKNRLMAFLTDVCFVWLYLAGMTFWLESSLQLDISIGICLLAALAEALLQQLAAGGWSENGAGRRWLGILSWCGALAVIALVAHRMWLSGIHQICNHAVDMLGHRFPNSSKTSPRPRVTTIWMITTTARMIPTRRTRTPGRPRNLTSWTLTGAATRKARTRRFDPLHRQPL